MPAKALVMVEGESDKVLVCLLTKKLGLSQRCGIKPYAEAKGGFCGVIKTQLNNPFARLVLLKDLDEKTEPDLVEEVEERLQGLGCAIRTCPLQWRFESGPTLYLIPVGLKDDPDLNSLGICRHSLESHLLRLLFDHPEKCVHERTGKQICNPQNLLQQILPVVRGYGLPLDSAKDVFQVLRGVLGWSGGPRDWLKKLLRDIEVETEGAFKVLCQRLKQAIG